MSFKTKTESYAYYKGYLKGLAEGKKQCKQVKSFVRQAEEPKWMIDRNNGKKRVYDDRPVDPKININDFFKKG